MRERTILSLDLGTSSCKAVLVGRDGSVRGIGKGSYPLHYTNGGGVEQNPDEMLRGVLKAVDELREAGNRMSDVAAISFSSQNSAQILIGENDQPLTNLISWMDARSAPQAKELTEAFSQKELKNLTGMDMEVVPGLNIPRMKWFRDTMPEIMGRTKFFIQIKEYVSHYLTGEWCSDYTSVKGMQHLFTHDTPPEILEFCGLQKNVVPPTKSPDAVIGFLKNGTEGFTGFTPGIPVVAGWNDMNAALLGMAGLPSVPLGFDLTGTSEHIGIVCPENLTDSGAMMDGVNQVHFLKDLTTIYGVSSAGGQALDWYRSILAESGESAADTFARLMKEAEQTDPAKMQQLIFLPYVQGERNPWRDPWVRASFQGISRGTTRGQMTLSVLEGIAFALLASYERLPVRPDRIIVSGGAAGNVLWNRIKADILETPFVRLQETEAGCIGAAILAWKASGFFSSMEEACTAMIRYGEVCEPRPEYSGMYHEKYSKFLQFYHGTSALYK